MASRLSPPKVSVSRMVSNGLISSSCDSARLRDYRAARIQARRELGDRIDRYDASAYSE